MPHDRNGHQINLGDWVRVKPHNVESLVVGRVAKVYPGADTCSGEIRWLGLGQIESSMFDAKDAVVVLGREGNLRTDPAEVTQV